MTSEGQLVKYLTLVFEVTNQEIDSQRNPFQIEVPGLKVVGAAAKDLMEENDSLRERLRKWEEDEP